MIRNEKEYRAAVERLREEQKRHAEHRGRLKDTGLTEEEIARALEPLYSFHLQLAEEVESYEKLKRGEFDEIENFDGVGRLLVAVRIAEGISQSELARRLGVSESQVSRDERNEYHGITLERVSRVMGALHLRVTTRVDADSIMQYREVVAA